VHSEALITTIPKKNTSFRKNLLTQLSCLISIGALHGDGKLGKSYFLSVIQALSAQIFGERLNC